MLTCSDGLTTKVYSNEGRRTCSINDHTRSMKVEHIGYSGCNDSG